LTAEVASVMLTSTATSALYFAVMAGSSRWPESLRTITGASLSTSTSMEAVEVFPASSTASTVILCQPAGTGSSDFHAAPSRVAT
jgi:hypothetical protein